MANATPLDRYSLSEYIDIYYKYRNVVKIRFHFMEICTRYGYFYISFRYWLTENSAYIDVHKGHYGFEII